MASLGLYNEEVIGVESRVPKRAQVPLGMATLFGGEPLRNSVRQSVGEGRDAIHGISSLIWTPGEVFELVRK